MTTPNETNPLNHSAPRNEKLPGIIKPRVGTTKPKVKVTKAAPNTTATPAAPKTN
jgi:hypothetical protein